MNQFDTDLSMMEPGDVAFLSLPSGSSIVIERGTLPEEYIVRRYEPDGLDWLASWV